MTWLYPQFLWALFLLAIPIIIHLFNFRRYKKILFTNLKFLKQVNTETKSGSQLRRYLILSARLLALTFLIFAFAQPILIKNKVSESGSFISIIIDNSFSMNQTGAEGLMFEAAKNRARIIVEQSNKLDRIQFITSNQDPALLHFVNKEDALEALDKISPQSQSFPLSDLLKLQNRLLNQENGDKRSYVISDFQKSKNYVTERHLDSSIVCQFIKVNGPIVDNLSIDTCWLSSPVIQKNETILLNVQISNYSDNDYEDLNLELMINGQPKGISNFNISSFDKSTTTIQFTLENSGLHTCELKLGGDLIPTDDQLFFNFYIKEQHQIVCISETINPFVDAIFQDNPGFAIQHNTYGNINYSNFKNSSLIVINEPKEMMSGLLSELDQYLKNGGNVVIFPHASEPFGGLKNTLSTYGVNIGEKAIETPLKMKQLDELHPIIKDIFEKKNKQPDYPITQKKYPLQIQQGITIASLEDGSIFLQDIPVKKGHLFVFSVPLNATYSNLQNHALFVPLMIKMGLLNQLKSSLYHQIGQMEPISTGLPYQSDKDLVLVNPKEQIVPGILNKDNELYLTDLYELTQAGHYQLKNKNSDSIRAYLSFNYDRSESDTRTIESNEMETFCKDNNIEYIDQTVESFNSNFKNIKKGQQLWKWCITFVLLFLLIEILLIRFFKPHAKLSA
jgi:hypothetical protein